MPTISPLAVTCPRCGRERYTPPGARREFGDPLPGTHSLTDTPRMICSHCAEDETLRAVAGLAPIPPEAWPVS